ncbi:MAG: leucyl/phenylalanyl-tRNA--protein transferase [Alphaproteobacteria bacterium RIFCSPHIGHO2_02_FULL_46_13]|nr:MAG: leucyl/phenylalanyl-tRNA--protein transferase [Alphaproteobacteria bacterium RIFCSPHIGHO2_02_FULL_46_13]
MEGTITPFDLLDIYKQGFFPMAEHREDKEFQFYAPHTRALLPIKDLHIPKRLKRKMHHVAYDMRIDTAFADVIHHCANVQRSKESNTWINDRIIALFIQLHEMGVAHSVETWRDGKLIGGLYGLTLGSTFCGESMFSIETDASKVALVTLTKHLDKQGFKLLDSQFRNPHLDQFGLYEIPQEEYVEMMQAGLRDKVSF